MKAMAVREGADIDRRDVAVATAGNFVSIFVFGLWLDSNLQVALDNI